MDNKPFIDQSLADGLTKRFIKDLQLKLSRPLLAQDEHQFRDLVGSVMRGVKPKQRRKHFNELSRLYGRYQGVLSINDDLEAGSKVETLFLLTYTALPDDLSIKARLTAVDYGEKEISLVGAYSKAPLYDPDGAVIQLAGIHCISRFLQREQTSDVANVIAKLYIGLIPVLSHLIERGEGAMNVPLSNGGMILGTVTSGKYGKYYFGKTYIDADKVAPHNHDNVPSGLSPIHVPF
ncbi:hypothetical protein LRP52_35970 [Photobacterium sp. ZSDE20]|uniref:DUF2612 domain-containing protein n=1 Tax=Photobacterium pectinilyticum TaxID=2906793 RepID=A0ABT1N5V8_9GAMM|nr:hypothetical protein [Photobacterium sp. ZSDE20]MCQ1060127.1 hypothetical protein [Photobacterium sp. ZSDE20]MDD1827583.1 hypothetical protein [Photobacterium sp. ZSDE20]